METIVNEISNGVMDNKPMLKAFVFFDVKRTSVVDVCACTGGVVSGHYSCLHVCCREMT